MTGIQDGDGFVPPSCRHQLTLGVKGHTVQGAGAVTVPGQITLSRVPELGEKTRGRHSHHGLFLARIRHLQLDLHRRGSSGAFSWLWIEGSSFHTGRNGLGRGSWLKECSLPLEIKFAPRLLGLLPPCGQIPSPFLQAGN